MDEQQMMAQESGNMMAQRGYMQTDPNELNSLMSKLLDVEPDIMEIELSLRGQRLNEKGEIVQVHKPLLNEEGVRNMIAITRSTVSQVTYVSSLDEDEIQRMITGLYEHIISDLTMNRSSYGIRSVVDNSRIRQIVCNKLKTSLNSALNNGMRRMLKGVIIETNVSTQGQMPKAKGGMGGLFSLGRK